MQKKFISTIAMTLLSSQVAMAGGDIVPVVEPTVTAPTVIENNGFYLGLGVSSMSLDNDLSNEAFSATGMMFQAGYQFYKYLAIEGRYTMNVGNLDYDHGDTNNPNYNDYPGDFSNIAIYLKPMVSFDNLTVYALLGYGEVTLTDLPYPSNTGSVDRAEDGFQWGLGANYMFMENISVFVDYVRVYDDKGFDYRAQNADITSDLWTLGVSYIF